MKIHCDRARVPTPVEVVDQTTRPGPVTHWSVQSTRTRKGCGSCVVTRPDSTLPVLEIDCAETAPPGARVSSRARTMPRIEGGNTRSGTRGQDASAGAEGQQR